jgi:hypothetical protein
MQNGKAAALSQSGAQAMSAGGFAGDDSKVQNFIFMSCFMGLCFYLLLKF